MNHAHPSYAQLKQLEKRPCPHEPSQTNASRCVFCVCEYTWDNCGKSIGAAWAAACLILDGTFRRENVLSTQCGPGPRLFFEHLDRHDARIRGQSQKGKSTL